ncbi:hypothetical protein [Janibacter terrae]|nr:hypothetical protein [Janibacter terrae]
MEGQRVDPNLSGARRVCSGMEVSEHHPRRRGRTPARSWVVSDADRVVL